MASWHPRPTPVTFEIDGVPFQGVIESIELTNQQYEVTCFGDPCPRYVNTGLPPAFEIRGHLMECFRTDPPMSERAVDKYREGGPILPMGKKLMARVPWSSKRVTIIGVSADGTMGYAKTVEEKQAIIFDDDFDYLLVAWPGIYSQDIFCVSDVSNLARALGLKPKSETTFIDPNGEEWSR